MPRPLRLESAGALHQLQGRGTGRRISVLVDGNSDADRCASLDTSAETVERFNGNGDAPAW